MRAFVLCVAFLLARSVAASDALPGTATDLKLETFAAAALAGDEPAIQRHIAEHEFARLVDKDGHSALFVAAHVGRIDLAEKLVLAGADVNLHDPKGSTAMYFAAANAQAEMVQWLIDHRARIARTGNEAPLKVACMAGHVDVVRVLLKAGAPIFGDYPAIRSSDVLDLAVVANRIEVLRVLLETDEAKRMPEEQLERLKKMSVGRGDPLLLQVLQKFQMSRSLDTEA